MSPLLRDENLPMDCTQQCRRNALFAQYTRCNDVFAANSRCSGR